MKTGLKTFVIKQRRRQATQTTPIPQEATRAAYSEENQEKKKKNSFCSEMANMKLILLFSVVIAIGFVTHSMF